MRAPALICIHESPRRQRGLCFACEDVVDGLIRAAVEEEREACAMLHESVNVACDHERPDVPGAGAMAAVIEYRDAIRARGKA